MEKEPELVIQAKDSKREYALKPVFIAGEHHAKVKELSQQTGLTMGELTETLLDFALEHLKVKPSKDGTKPE